MKVVLVNVYFASTRVRYMSSSYVLKAYFEANSRLSEEIDVEVLNYSSGGTVDDIAAGITEKRPDVIGFSCYIWNIDMVTKLLEVYRREFGGTVILGGPEIARSTAAELGQRQLADYFIIGEGEIALTELLENMYEKEISVLPGGVATYNSTTKTLRYNADSPRVDMKRIPSIYTTGTIPQSLYRGELVFLETQRGCKYNCMYCVYNKGLKGITFREIEDVKNEITFLLKNREISSIRIVDPTFSANLEYAKKNLRHFIDLKNEGYTAGKIMIEYEYTDVDAEFVGLIAKLKTKAHIHNYAKPDLPKDALIGAEPPICDGYTVYNGVGIQSFNNDSLRAVHRKPIKDTEIRNFFEICKTNNIMLKLDMILGLPQESCQSYLAGLDRLMGYMRDTDHYFQPAVLQVLAGSTLEEHAEDWGLCYHLVGRNVYRTNTMDESDFGFCIKITGLLYRVLNSPLRLEFYHQAESSGMSYIDYAQHLLKGLERRPETADYFSEDANDLPYEHYLGRPIFKAIPQAVLLRVLRA